MPEATFACPKCKTAFAIEPGTEEVSSDCPNCLSHLEARFYPPFFRPTEVGQAAATLVDHTEASCFYHAQKQAVGICDGCGRLVCALCSIDMGNEQLCPNCLSAGKKKGKLTTLENTRTRYDNIALSMAVFGFFTSFFTFVLAPAAIYMAIRYWNSPGSLLGVSRTRFIIAIIVAIVSLVVWVGIFGLAIFGPQHHHHR